MARARRPASRRTLAAGAQHRRSAVHRSVPPRTSPMAPPCLAARRRSHPPSKPRLTAASRSMPTYSSTEWPRLSTSPSSDLAPRPAPSRALAPAFLRPVSSASPRPVSPEPGLYLRRHRCAGEPRPPQMGRGGPRPHGTPDPCKLFAGPPRWLRRTQPHVVRRSPAGSRSPNYACERLSAARRPRLSLAAGPHVEPS